MVPRAVCALSLALLLAVAGPTGTRAMPPAAPPAGEVATCGGDAARTGAMPGPGPVGRPTLRWMVAAEGLTSPPIVAAGLVFASNRDGLFALDPATGAERWRAAQLTLQRCTPVAAGLVYGSGHGAVVALDAANGAERWRFAGDDQFFLIFAPAVAGDLVYVGVLEPAQDPDFDESQEGFVYALEAADGSVRWRVSTGTLSATAIALDDDLAFVGASDDLSGGPEGALIALDAATGQERWRLQPGDRPRLGPPAVADGIVYVGGLAEDEEAGRGLIYALDTATGTELWRADLGPRGTLPPAVVDGVVYAGAGDRALHALDAATGQELWRFAPADADDFYVSSAPTVAMGVVYVDGGNGTLYAIAVADRAERWRLALGTAGSSGTLGVTPAVVGGIVYATALDGLYAVGSEA